MCSVSSDFNCRFSHIAIFFSCLLDVYSQFKHISVKIKIFSSGQTTSCTQLCNMLPLNWAEVETLAMQPLNVWVASYCGLAD